MSSSIAANTANGRAAEPLSQAIAKPGSKDEYAYVNDVRVAGFSK